MLDKYNLFGFAKQGSGYDAANQTGPLRHTAYGGLASLRAVWEGGSLLQWGVGR